MLRVIRAGLVAVSLMGIAAVPLAGCAGFGLVQPKGFEESLAVGYQSVTTGANLAGVLLDAGKISPADARNAHTSLTTFKEGLDLADQIHAQDTTAGEARLNATLAGIDAILAYLQSKQ